MSVRFPLRVIQDAYQTFDTRVEQTVALAHSTEGKTSPCRRGCSACCSEPLVVTQYCMPPIIERIRAMSADEQAAIKQRIFDWARVVMRKGIHPDVTDPDLDFAAWHRQPKPVCPLLEVSTGDCSVYEARPLGCRGHVSVEKDRTPCDRTDPAYGVGVLLFHDEIARVMSHVMSHSLRGEGRDVPLLMLLLPSMLRRAWVLVERPTMTYYEWFEDIELRYRTGQSI